MIQLRNSFYRDEPEMLEEQDRKTALGSYCVLGYFDALEIHPAEEPDKIWSKRSQISMEKSIKRCNSRVLVCISMNDSYDEEFWREQNQKPFYFTSLVRVRQEKLKSEDLTEKLKEINQMDPDPSKNNEIGYLSYDHSEVVVIYKTDRYSDGMSHIAELKNRFSILKMYTIFAISERVLQTDDVLESEIREEQLDVRFHAKIKDFQNAENFYSKLKKELQEINVPIYRYDTLGGNDWLMEADGLSLHWLLKNYRMGNLLTHTNEEYEKAFFNLETEMFPSVRKKGGGEDGSGQ